jgi:hypothetical protein
VDHLDAGASREQLAGDVATGADAERGPADRPRIAPGERNEAGEIVDAQRCMDDSATVTLPICVTGVSAVSVSYGRSLRRLGLIVSELIARPSV